MSEPKHVNSDLKDVTKETRKGHPDLPPPRSETRRPKTEPGERSDGVRRNIPLGVNEQRGGRDRNERKHGQAPGTKGSSR